ncbi:hypothetical protein FRB94_009336 [Tulasnella sp. JGI-2019a]|nr:hypothetical protein FRB94_009336 [Tulasnella sp. JGI-2019a]KAG9004873.1 hypothetical protein FRB93_010052 [Tulasnella sp. JGI-2019a]
MDATDGTSKLLEGGVTNFNFGMGAQDKPHVVVKDQATPMAATAQRLPEQTFIYVFHQKYKE